MTDDSSSSRIREDAATTDIGDARTALSAIYEGISWTAEETEEDFAFRYAAAGDAAMTVRAIRFDGHLQGEMPAGDDFVVAQIIRGVGILDVGTGQVVLQPGRPQLWPTESFQFDFYDYDQRLVQINRTAVENLLTERGHEPTRFRLDHHVQPTDDALRQWKNTIGLISTTVLDPTVSPVLQAEMGRVAAVALLELYPVATDDLPPGLLVPKHAHIRAAVEYIHEHPSLPISTTDLAQIANVSLRTLQETFQRLLGVTPNAYLRQVRLERIRDELLHAEPATTSTADVARRWGFAHPGRFAAAYAAAFGCYPRDTLHQARP